MGFELHLETGLDAIVALQDVAPVSVDDFDQAIIDWMADEFKKTNSIDLRQDRMALQRLKEAAEKFKDSKPLLHAATAENIDDMAAVAKETGCPVATMDLYPSR